MNKVPMRPRQIDFNKPLAILREDKDINVTTSDFLSVPKGGITFATGMEKEEESEHHLQQVLCSARKEATIPVPEVIDDISEFEHLYSSGYKLPSQFITHQNLDPAEEKEIDYDMDAADEAWLSSANSTITREMFETLMDCFEKGCGKKVPVLKEALSLVKTCTSIGNEAAIAVFDYWLEKRAHRPEGFIYAVKHDGQEPVSNSDPYVAFRRRSEKMQTRRHRRSDELSYEKMFLFHQNLLHLKGLTYDVYLRDLTKNVLAEKAYEIDQFRMKNPEVTCDTYRKAQREAASCPVDSKAFFRNLKQRSDNEKERSRIKRRGSVSIARDSDNVLETSSSENEFDFIRTDGVQYERCRTDFLRPGTEEDDRFASQKFLFCEVPNACHNVVNDWHGFARPRMSRLRRRIIERKTYPVDSSPMNEIPRKIVCLQVPISKYRVKFVMDNSDMVIPSTIQINSLTPFPFRGLIIPTQDSTFPNQNFSSASEPVFSPLPYSNCSVSLSTHSSPISSERAHSFPSQPMCMKPGSANGSDSGMGSAPSTPPAVISAAPSQSLYDGGEQFDNGSRKRFAKPLPLEPLEMDVKYDVPVAKMFPRRKNSAFNFSSDSRRPQAIYDSSNLPLTHYHPRNKTSWESDRPSIQLLHESS